MLIGEVLTDQYEPVTIQSCNQSDLSLLGFIQESNRIEGITREPNHGELMAHKRFARLPHTSIKELSRFVCDVRVGKHVPPPGGFEIPRCLDLLLREVNMGALAPYEAHQRYESLHPFTDGNGRSGRVLWLWMMNRQGGAPLGFLHHWYCQSLETWRG